MNVCRQVHRRRPIDGQVNGGSGSGSGNTPRCSNTRPSKTMSALTLTSECVFKHLHASLLFAHKYPQCNYITLFWLNNIFTTDNGGISTPTFFLDLQKLICG